MSNEEVIRAAVSMLTRAEASDHAIERAVKTLGSRRQEEEQVILAEAGAIPALVALLASHNFVVKMEAAHTLSNQGSISAGPYRRRRNSCTGGCAQQRQP